MDNLFITINPNLPASIKDVKVIYDKHLEKWYLNIIYSYNDPKEGPMELEFPKVPLPIPHSHLPEIDHSIPVDDAIRRSFWAGGGSPVFNFYPKVDLQCGYLNGQQYYFTVTKISKDMTKEDIEKELGYPINIVDKKG